MGPSHPLFGSWRLGPDLPPTTKDPERRPAQGHRDERYQWQQEQGRPDERPGDILQRVPQTSQSTGGSGRLAPGLEAWTPNSSRNTRGGS